MQEIICFLIAFLTLSHGEFSSENDLNYGRKFYNIENKTHYYNDFETWHGISQQPQYSHQSYRQFKCTKPGLYADENDCRTYYECAKIENKRRLEFRQTVHKCNSDQVFSYAYGTCTQPQESGRVKCSGYSRLEEQHNTETSPNIPSNTRKPKANNNNSNKINKKENSEERKAQKNTNHNTNNKQNNKHKKHDKKEKKK